MVKTARTERRSSGHCWHDYWRPEGTLCRSLTCATSCGTTGLRAILCMLCRRGYLVCGKLFLRFRSNKLRAVIGSVPRTSTPTLLGLNGCERTHRHFSKTVRLPWLLLACTRRWSCGGVQHSAVSQVCPRFKPRPFAWTSCGLRQWKTVLISI